MQYHGHRPRWGASPTYTSWRRMRDRCQNPNSQHYADYGGRGITVCARWGKFENFLADMGERPAGKTLDRKDTNGGYEPGNCRWATAREQCLNRRPRRDTILHGGKTVKEWQRLWGVSYGCAYQRIARLTAA